ncbi:hypothetical protein R6Q57_009915 [Mikania cordata]
MLPSEHVIFDCMQSAAGNSWLGSLIGTIIGNVKISIGNVHIRYEDSVSNPGHPFAVGITLAKLAAFTVDEKGNETFDTSGALDKLQKSLQLERLAMYHDSNRPPWNMDKKWEDLSPKDWVEMFEDGINEPAKGRKFSKWAQDRSYLVSPINGVLKYHRLGNSKRTSPKTPFEEAHLILGDVSLTLTEAQYHDWIRLLEIISRYKSYVEVSHLRPVVPVTECDTPHSTASFLDSQTPILRLLHLKTPWKPLETTWKLKNLKIEARYPPRSLEITITTLLLHILAIQKFQELLEPPSRSFGAFKAIVILGPNSTLQSSSKAIYPAVCWFTARVVRP